MPDIDLTADLIDCRVCNGSGLVILYGNDVQDCPCTYRRPCDLMCRCSGGPL